MRALKVASYNVHGGVGLDRRFAPERIAAVVHEIGADVIALQEWRSFAGGLDLLEYLRGQTGFHAVAGATMQLPDGEFGNGLLTRFPIASSRRLDLSLPGREPRAAIDALLDVEGSPLRVIATHLGLRPDERRRQIDRLIDAMSEGPETPAILLGDINEWFARSRTLRRLHEYFGNTASPATYPSIRPLFALDRIWCRPAGALRQIEAWRSPTARRASDHLPLVASVKFD